MEVLGVNEVPPNLCHPNELEINMMINNTTIFKTGPRMLKSEYGSGYYGKNDGRMSAALGPHGRGVQEPQGHEISIEDTNIGHRGG